MDQKRPIEDAMQMTRDDAGIAAIARKSRHVELIPLGQVEE